jgi:lysozyme
MEKFIQVILSLLQSILSGLATSTTKKQGGASQGLSGTPERMSISNLEIIKESEGLRLKAYLPTPNDVYTIGYGHTKTAEKEMVITLAGAEALLLHDLKWVEDAIHKYVKVPLNQNQYDALCSFVYNLGATNFKNSTLLKKLNKKDYNGAAHELLRWDKQKGKVLRGLTKRRQLEKDLFLS